MNAADRLAELLNDKDRQIDELESKVVSLKNEIAGSGSGWRAIREITDDPDLPVPRLEICYVPDATIGWRDYTAVYRIVVVHLLGNVLAIPLSSTRSASSNGTEPQGLPFRDGAHIVHDAGHLTLPAFRIMPGKEPERIKFDTGHQFVTGVKHRREVEI